MHKVTNALKAAEAMVDPTQRYLLLGRLTHADVTAVLAERIARLGQGIDTPTQMPRLHALSMRLAEEPEFHATQP